MQKRYEAQLFLTIIATDAGYRAYPTRRGNLRIYAEDRPVTVADVTDKVFYGGIAWYPLKAWKGQVIVNLSHFPGAAVRC